MNIPHRANCNRRRVDATAEARGANPCVTGWRLALLALGCALGAWLGHGALRAALADDERAAKARAVQTRVAEIEAERRNTLRLEADVRAARDEGEARTRRLEQDLAAVQDGATERTQELEELRGEASRLALQITELERTEADAGKALLEASERLASAIAVGIPFRRHDRWTALQAIRARMLTPEPAARVWAYAELLAFALDELRLGASRELTSAAVAASEDATPQCFVLRLGLVNLIAVSEDGTAVGRSTASNDASWRFDLDPSESAAIRAAVRIHRRLAPHRVEHLPFEIGASAPRSEPASSRSPTGEGAPR
ncbi:MAG: DUF3450 family protein [Planctomycetota bacterium]